MYTSFLHIPYKVITELKNMENRGDGSRREILLLTVNLASKKDEDRGHLKKD